MPALDPRQQDSSIPSKYDEEILRDLFTDAPANHDILWDNIQPEEAAYIRRALIQAHKLRQSHADPGDAYLQGIAITLEAERRRHAKVRHLLKNRKSALTVEYDDGVDRQPAV